MTKNLTHLNALLAAMGIGAVSLCAKLSAKPCAKPGANLCTKVGESTSSTNKVKKMLSALLLTVFVSLNIVWASAQAQQFKVLVFSKTAGFHHTSIVEAIEAVRHLSKKHYFDIDWQENAKVFNDEDLAAFDAVMFLQTTGDVLNDEQQAAFERFIASGKGFIGVHSASVTEADWPWYSKLVGRKFIIHPKVQSAKLQVINRDFPGLELFPDVSLFTDEWYEFGPELSDNLKYLLTVDETSYNPKAKWSSASGEGMGDFHPIAWYQEVYGGRSFYTSLGHLGETYSDAAFLRHLYGGIYWSATGLGLD